MPKSYLPSREADLVEWLENFKAKIEPSPGAYGLSPGQATDEVAAIDAFVAAYGVANDPNTRTKVSIQAKNTAKEAVLTLTRSTVAVCQAWPAMTDAKRDELRVSVRDRELTPIGPPEEIPVLRVAAVNGRVFDLEVRRTDGTTKTKPAGVRGVWLYSHTGENPPTQLSGWKFEGGSTKSNPQLVFPDTLAPGTEVWITALWVNPTDQPGPACAPVKSHINYVGLNQAA